jgi:hypothetical protein
LAAQCRDLARGIERAAGVALEPVEIETQGPERNERRQDRVGRAVQPALRLGEFVTRDTPQFGAGGSVGAARAVAGGDVGGTLLPVSGLILARPQVEEIYNRWRQMALEDRDTATLALNRALAAHAERLKQRESASRMWAT